MTVFTLCSSLDDINLVRYGIYRCAPRKCDSCLWLLTVKSRIVNTRRRRHSTTTGGGGSPLTLGLVRYGAGVLSSLSPGPRNHLQPVAANHRVTKAVEDEDKETLKRVKDDEEDLGHDGLRLDQGEIPRDPCQPEQDEDADCVLDPLDGVLPTECCFVRLDSYICRMR